MCENRAGEQEGVPSPLRRRPPRGFLAGHVSESDGLGFEQSVVHFFRRRVCLRGERIRLGRFELLRFAAGGV